MSSALDDDTMRTIQSGRQTAGAVLGTAKKHLQKVFIVFVLGLVGTIYALRIAVWDFLRANTRSQMSSAIDQQLKIIARNPFDVILVQVKIGLFVGIFLALPVLIYLSRDSLREQGFTSAVPISRVQLALFGVLAAALFTGGIFYAYAVFFPVMFNFLATNAINAAVKPNYDIVLYVQFLLLLTVSFGAAAQLPLFMSVLSYTEVVPYETFRDKWKYAILIIFAFGAMFSPPDPFTQIMWAVPLCALYAFSLGLSKLVTNIRRAESSDASDFTVRDAVLRVVALFVLSGVGAGVGAARGGLEYFNANVRPSIPAFARPGPLSVEGIVGIGGTPGVVLFGLVSAIVVTVTVIFAFVIRVLNQPVVPRTGPGHDSPAPDPADIDLSELDEAGVKAAPPEAFLELDEDEASALAYEAMEDQDDPEKAQAILDRFDEVHEGADVDLSELDAEGVREAPPGAFLELDEEEATALADEAMNEEDDPEKARAILDRFDEVQESAGEDAKGDGEDEESDVVTSTAAGMADAFVEEDEVTEDDIGGYFYDITFIIQSLTSKAFRVVGVFMVALGVSFFWLYRGGLGTIKSTFFKQVDPALLRKAAGTVDPDAVAVAQGSARTAAGIASDAALVSVPVGGDPSPSAANYIVALHPVEQLIFEVKVSTIVGAIVAMPVVLYYAWPAIEERGFATGGDRRVFLVWGLSLIGGMVAGSLVGFFYVAPTIISWLVSDALEAGMVISYRLNVFMWLVILTTLGIGLLADIPVTMWLFDRGGIVSYETMRERWRVVVMAVFATAGLVIPGGVLTMLILALPVCFAYAAGLGLLWLLTLPRRLFGGGREAAAS